MLFAVVWAVALVMAAVYLPIYESVGGTSTFVETNGTSGALVAAMPLVLSLATIVALRLRGQLRAGALAWTLTILCAGFALVAITSFGAFVVPVVACLIYACVVHGRPRGQSAGLEFQFPFTKAPRGRHNS